MQKKPYLTRDQLLPITGRFTYGLTLEQIKERQRKEVVALLEEHKEILIAYYRDSLL